MNCYYLCRSLFFFGLMRIFCAFLEIVFLDRVHQPLSLVVLRNLYMLKTVRTINTNLTVLITCKYDWRNRIVKANDCFWCVQKSLACWVFRVFIEPCFKWGERIDCKIPNFDSTVIRNTCENRRCLWCPADIVNLVL